MQNSLEADHKVSVVRGKKRIAIFIAGLLILPGLLTAVSLNISSGNKEPPIVVIRVDDIQDFAFREAQLFLLNESMISNVPLSLAIITGMFGEDREIVQTVKLAVALGSDAAVHGWEHEDLAKLSFEEQVTLLSRARNQIKETIDFNTKILVPPMFSYNEDTVLAMQEEGYNIISTFIDISEPGLTWGVSNLPATVELADFSNGFWKMKSLDLVRTELSSSFQKYGFAVIVTHPQEFVIDGKLNQVNTELYQTLLETLKKEEYSLQTLEMLGDHWQ